MREGASPLRLGSCLYGRVLVEWKVVVRAKTFDRVALRVAATELCRLPVALSCPADLVDPARLDHPARGLFFQGVMIKMLKVFFSLAF